MHLTHDSVSLHRWKTARRVVLGAVLLAGSMATTAAAVQRMTMRQASVQSVQLTEEVYSGIGVTITARHGQVMVTDVNTQGPAMDQIYPGALLVSVDGESPRSILDWKARLRGEPGSSVELEVQYNCGGKKVVTLERDLIYVRH